FALPQGYANHMPALINVKSSGDQIQRLGPCHWVRKIFRHPPGAQRRSSRGAHAESSDSHHEIAVKISDTGGISHGGKPPKMGPRPFHYCKRLRQYQVKSRRDPLLAPMATRHKRANIAVER